MALYFALSLCALARPPDPRIEGPKAPVPSGEGVVFRILARVPGGISVDECASIDIERRVADAWDPVPGAGCPARVPAKLVGDTLTVTVPPLPAGEYRAGLSWGSGCQAELPFELAGCSALGVAWSEPFTVQAAAVPAPAPR